MDDEQDGTRYDVRYSLTGKEPLKSMVGTLPLDTQIDVVLAMRRIRSTLSLNPSEQGESRNGNARILIDRPVAVIYAVYDDVYDDGFSVIIYESWLIPKALDRKRNAPE